MHNLFEMHKSIWIQNLPETTGLNNVTKKLFNNYYEHIESEFIFERSGWGTPGNLEMLDKLNYKPKFLLLVRPLVEVLASYIKIQKQKDVEHSIFKLMHPDYGKIYWDWQSTSNIIKTNQNYLLIKYDDLVNSTEDKIKEIYNFFDIPDFKHSFENIQQFTYSGIKYNDSPLEANLHTIRSTIKKENYNVKEYLPKDIIKRYEGWDFF
jgi:hypothetical protein